MIVNQVLVNPMFCPTGWMWMPGAAVPARAASLVSSMLASGLVPSGVALLLVGALYLALRLRHSARARTSREFFIFDKKVTESQFCDTAVAYNLQVVVMVFFIYWGFVYGIGMFYYALTWFAGIFLFQLSAPRLIKFAVSYDTLHGFLAQEYGASAAIRRITAFCTLLGLIGGLLIEVSLTTDILASVLMPSAGNVLWIAGFGLLLLTGWIYLAMGGYKSAVLTYGIQLPVIYLTLAVVMCYLVWAGFHAGYYRHSLALALLIFSLWAAIFIARTKGSFRKSRLDNASLAAFASSLLVMICSAAFLWVYRGHPNSVEAVADSPDSFRLAAFATQDKLLIAGFSLLNLASQFCDMSAWQRVSSLRLADSVPEQIRQLKAAIGETKWESPLTWGFGIALGIALRHSGLFHGTNEALDAFNAFAGALARGGASGPELVRTCIVLPCLLVGIVSIMLSTLDGFLTTVIFAWNADIANHGQDPFSSQTDQEESLQRARRASLVLLFIAATLFVWLYRFEHVNIFLLLNLVASAQFIIAFLSVGALFLPSPWRWKNIAITATAMALAANLATALYCYIKMQGGRGQAWGDWFYVLPTIWSAVVGVLVFASLSAFAVNRSRDAAPSSKSMASSKE